MTLTSQSALQVHPSPDGITHLQSSYHVDDGAHLHCHWHPLIPFADARIDQRIDVNIAGGGYLYWSDALMSGRHARGERWTFASLAHELAVSRDGPLEYLKRYHLQPNERAVSRPWAAGDASYLGTTLMTGRPIELDVAERLQGFCTGSVSRVSATVTARAAAIAWRLATVVDVQVETLRTLTLVLDVPGWPGHRAGQHVDVRLTAEMATRRSEAIPSPRHRKTPESR